MKDIDFDELDRAVNSLMGPTDTPVNAQPAPAVSSTPQPAPIAEPVVPAPVVVTNTEPVANTPPSPASLRSTLTPPARKSGRFMDMVHSSSDMTSRTPEGPREGVKITPINPGVVPESIVEEPSVDDAGMAVVPDSFTAQKLDNEVVDSNSRDDTVMPDPLDMPQQDEATLEEILAQPQPKPIVQLEQNESPFLADAKVEKRPLNSDSSLTTPLVDLEDELHNDLGDDSTSETDDNKKDDEPPITPQVPELSSDLLAIEAGDNLEAEPVIEEKIAEPKQEVTEPKNEPVVAAQPTGATSIAQQYKAGDSTGDKDHAAIYDTSQYPEPLAHPAKKKAGFLWILWIILFLAIGGGGAVGLYMLGIIP